MSTSNENENTQKVAGDQGDPVVSNNAELLKNGGQDSPAQADADLGRGQPAGHQPAGEPAGEHVNDSNTDLVNDQQRDAVRTHAPMNPGELDPNADHGKTQAGHLQNRNGDWQHPAHAGQPTMLENGSDAQWRLQQRIKDGDTRARCEREGVPVPDDVRERLEAAESGDRLAPAVDSAGNQDPDPVTRNIPVNYSLSEEELEEQRAEVRQEQADREEAERQAEANGEGLNDYQNQTKQ